MITTLSKKPKYLVQFTDGTHISEADAPVAKGGQEAAFGPHQLLEASLATCINIWIRMQADKKKIPVGAITVTVSLKRDDPENAIFTYAVKLEGPLSERDRATLLQDAEDCPVRNTLSKKLSFDRKD
jgi:putative redox protein